MPPRAELEIEAARPRPEPPRRARCPRGDDHRQLPGHDLPRRVRPDQELRRRRRPSCPPARAPSRSSASVDLPLAPGGPYHARVVATNGSGAAASHDLDVLGQRRTATSPPTQPPAPTTTPAITPAPARRSAPARARDRPRRPARPARARPGRRHPPGQRHGPVQGARRVRLHRARLAARTCRSARWSTRATAASRCRAPATPAGAPRRARSGAACSRSASAATAAASPTSSCAAGASARCGGRRRRLRAGPRGRRQAARRPPPLGQGPPRPLPHPRARQRRHRARHPLGRPTDRCDGTLTKVSEGKVARARPAPQAQRPADRRTRLPRAPPALAPWSGAGTGWSSSRPMLAAIALAPRRQGRARARRRRGRDRRHALRGARRRSRPSDVAVVAIDDATFSDLERPVAVPALAARARDRRAAPRRARSRSSTTSSSPSRPTEREDLALFDAVRRAGDVVLATTETDGHGGTNVLGGDENLAARARTPRRRTSRPIAAA